MVLTKTSFNIRYKYGVYLNMQYVCAQILQYTIQPDTAVLHYAAVINILLQYESILKKKKRK